MTVGVALRSPLSSAPPGSRRTGGRCDWIRALQRCMRGTAGQIPGFTCHRKTKCIRLKKNTTQYKTWLKMAVTLKPRGADKILRGPISAPRGTHIYPRSPSGRRLKEIKANSPGALLMFWDALTHYIKLEDSWPNFYVKKINPDLIEVWRT